MAIRAELNMKFGKKTWNVAFSQSKKIFELTLNEKPVLTPKGNPVAHKNERLIYHMMAELRCLKTLEPKLSTLWLYSSAVDHEAELNKTFRGNSLRGLLLTDPVLARSAAPDCAMAQMTDWCTLWKFLSENEIKYPDLPQCGNPEEHLRECGDEAVANFDKLSQAIENEVSAMSIAQRSIIANATNCYHSLTYAFFLAANRLSPLEFAAGITSAQCAIPWAFGDIDLNEYSDALHAVTLDASMMKTFGELF